VASTSPAGGGGEQIISRERPTFAEALAVWLKIGLLGFGGPAGQIALMHRLIVEEKRWVSEQRFLTGLNFCMLLPGPEAQQLATYIGWLLHGVRGGVLAGTLFVLPGFCVLLVLSTVYVLFSNTSWLGNLFFGLKAAVLAIVIEAVFKVSQRALKNRVMVAISAAAFIAIYALRAPFPLIILLAGLAGFVGARSRPDLFAPGSEGASLAGDPIAAAPRAAELGWRRALKIIAICGALWAAPIVALSTVFGAGSVYPVIASFFSKMAVVTFGGAYAVLSYVAQQAAGPLGWVTPGEMLDGLALAETTPGPLILVLVYVGFLAGFRNPGGVAPLAGGLIGASLTTWVTFVPCFLWIFLGAPYVEAIGRNKTLSGALAAITAAVVGVILNLAIWFSLHTLFHGVGVVHLGPLALAWPNWASLDPWALALSGIAGVALFGLRLGMIATLALCAGLGLALKFVV
jgi:chromate transporter